MRALGFLSSPGDKNIEPRLSPADLQGGTKGHEWIRGKSKDISPVREAVHLGGSTDTEGTKFHQGWRMKGGSESEESRRTQALEPPRSDIVCLSVVLALRLPLALCSPNCPAIPGEHSHEIP